MGRAEQVCADAVASEVAWRQRVNEMESGTQLLYDDLEHALK